MPSPISYVNITDPLPYCTVADIKNLIGSVMPIQESTFTDAQIAAAIPPAQRYIESVCNRTFYPHRKTIQFDGNGTGRAVLRERPVININALTIYATFPINVSRVAYDYQLMVDHSAGIISFPSYNGSSATFAPFAFQFIRGSKNITADIQVGFTQENYAQPLSTTDNQTFTFPVAGVVNKSTVVSPDSSVPPAITPTIYLNGAPLTNTTYVYVTNNSQASWQIATDQLFYRVNSDGTGITSVTFNAPLSSNAIVTADFKNAYIPDDINEACTKLAAIRCLQSMAVGWYGNQFDGLASTQSEGTRIELHNSGRWGHQTDAWTQDIKNILATNTRINIGSLGSSFIGWAM